MLGLMAVKMMAAADKLTIWDRERSRKDLCLIPIPLSGKFLRLELHASHISLFEEVVLFVIVECIIPLTWGGSLGLTFVKSKSN